MSSVFICSVKPFNNPAFMGIHAQQGMGVGNLPGSNQASARAISTSDTG